MNTESIDASAGAGTSPVYTERLRVPASWWVPVGFVVATFWFACWVVIVEWWAHLPGLLAASGAAIGLYRFGALRVGADRTGVIAGGDRLPISAIESVEVLTPTRARVLRGGGSDATAHYVLRPYVDTAVRVQLTERAAPPPYWYLATRHPERLAATLRAVGVSPVTPDQPRQTRGQPSRPQSTSE